MGDKKTPVVPIAETWKLHKKLGEVEKIWVVGKLVKQVQHISQEPWGKAGRSRAGKARASERAQHIGKRVHGTPCWKYLPQKFTTEVTVLPMLTVRRDWTSLVEWFSGGNCVWRLVKKVANLCCCDAGSRSFSGTKLRVRMLNSSVDLLRRGVNCSFWVGL